MVLRHRLNTSPDTGLTWVINKTIYQSAPVSPMVKNWHSITTAGFHTEVNLHGNCAALKHAHGDTATDRETYAQQQK